MLGGCYAGLPVFYFYFYFTLCTYTPNSRFLVQETFPKTLPRFVSILITLQRWQYIACKETKPFVSPHLIGPQLHQHLVQRQNKDGCANGGIFTTDNVTKTA